MSIAPVPLNISYVDPDGGTWNLSDYSMKKGYICSAIAGIEGFPVNMQTIPTLDGTAIPNIYIPQPGTIGLAITVTRPASDSQNDYYDLLDRINYAFLTRRNQQPAYGTLIIQRPNGNARMARTYTITGLDAPDVGANDTCMFSFSLQTPDPYWYDVGSESLVYTMNGPNDATGILPLLPVALNSGALFGDSTILNAGGATTYPTWTITGPGTPLMTNKTTGLRWALNTSVPAGQQVQVVTQRGAQSVMNLTSGANWWTNLIASSFKSLWPLVAGINNINIELDGATAQSQVQVSWTSRWNRA